MLDQTRKVYFAPDDRTQEVFLSFIATAKKSIYIADYSLVMEPLVEALIAKHKGGIDVKLCLDRTQAAGTAERPEIQQLRDAGIPMQIGQSTEHHIMHNKFTILDGEWVQYGSWNYTTTATKESNFFFIEHSPDLAKVFLANWQEIWNWIAAHPPTPKG